jgi:hypothetical protein
MRDIGLIEGGGDLRDADLWRRLSDQVGEGFGRACGRLCQVREEGMRQARIRRYG